MSKGLRPVATSICERIKSMPTTATGQRFDHDRHISVLLIRRFRTK